MNKTGREYWEKRYQNNETGWDMGYASPPITHYIGQLQRKEIRILIPGAGNGYEAEFLFRKGFKNIFVLDFSKTALSEIQKRIPDLPKNHLFKDNFFSHQGKYDLIIEQTFFSSIAPHQRPAYAKKMSDLLSTGGKLTGLLFDFPLTENGPPYGGSVAEYRNLFSEYFFIRTLETCYNSIKPRSGRELFIIFEKKNKV